MVNLQYVLKMCKIYIIYMNIHTAIRNITCFKRAVQEERRLKLQVTKYIRCGMSIFIFTTLKIKAFNEISFFSLKA